LRILLGENEKSRFFICSLKNNWESSDEIVFCGKNRNLSNLNLGGEISPAIGELKSLQFVWVDD
jgi:hypothetical protein